jgi:hypothetical protein
VGETTGGGFETLREDKTQFYFNNKRLTKIKQKLNTHSLSLSL